MKASQYDQDFYAWANEQAALLRSGKVAEADIEHIAEEIESMGRSEKRELVNRLTVLLLHLLKWQFQPGLRGNSWRLSIENTRYQLEDHLDDNPSLKSHLDDAMRSAYRRAMNEAELETGLPRSMFPLDCPFTFAQAMTADFWPE
jgi:predicted  nucleic acid-binding Zn-ribbon protein